MHSGAFDITFNFARINYIYRPIHPIVYRLLYAMMNCWQIFLCNPERVANCCSIKKEK